MAPAQSSGMPVARPQGREIALQQPVQIAAIPPSPLLFAEKTSSSYAQILIMETDRVSLNDETLFTK
jgi:hypothetical protein